MHRKQAYKKNNELCVNTQIEQRKILLRSETNLLWDVLQRWETMAFRHHKTHHHFSSPYFKTHHHFSSPYFNTHHHFSPPHFKTHHHFSPPHFKTHHHFSPPHFKTHHHFSPPHFNAAAISITFIMQV